MCTSAARVVNRSANFTSTASAAGASRQAEHSAGQRQHHALGEQLAHEAPAAGAQRGADGEFALQFQHARQQQVGHICAGDEQHETGAGQQHQERRRGRVRVKSVCSGATARP